MGDVYDKEKRSEVMRKVRSKGNKSTELRLISLFKENGITGWRRNYHVKGLQILFFLKSVLPYLWMDVSGTDITAGIRRPSEIRNIGRKNGRPI